MNKKAVIFDMDGVLFDTEEYYYHRRKNYLADLGISIDHLAPSYFVGGNMKDVWGYVLGDNPDNWDKAVLQEGFVRYKEEHTPNFKELIFPDTVSILSYLKAEGYKIGLASSSLKSTITQALKEGEIEHFFDVVLSGEDFKASKPHPEIYQRACERLGVEPTQALIIEDSQKGIAAGKAAGVGVWAIQDYRFGMDQGQADRLVENLAQVERLLKGEE